MTQHVGGTHYRTLVREGAWYQTFGSELLVLEPRSARVLDRTLLGRVGEVGAAVDMAVNDDRLYIALDSDAVVELDISQADRPRIVERRNSDELGIAPLRISVVGGEVYVSGTGGVVRWSDGMRIFPNPGNVSHVAMSDEGLVGCVGRRIYRLEDGQFVGSASDLIPATGLGVPIAGVDPAQALVFVRHSPQGALVGLLGSNLRELDSDKLTIGVPGRVRQVRVFGEKVWVVTDTEIMAFVVEAGSLVQRMHIDILGARDVAPLDDNHLAVAGSFGRSMYRMRSSERGPGDTFLQVHREPSRLTQARWDGRYILAGSEEGNWLYLVGSRVELSDESLDRGGEPPEPIKIATSLGARARINEDGSVLSITTEEGVYEHVEPHGETMHCVVPVEGEFWVAHDRGITVLRPRPVIITPAERRREAVIDVQADRVIERLRLDGPVRYLFQLRIGRGAAFVSEFGGFGTARWEEEPIDTMALR